MLLLSRPKISTCTQNLYRFSIGITILFCSVFVGCERRTQEAPIASTEPVNLVELEQFPAQSNAHLPRLVESEGTLYASWVTQQDSVSILKFSMLDQGSWSPPETIAKGSNWFVNWADFPQIAVHKGVVLATYLEKSAQGTYDYDIKYTLRDDTEQWSLPATLHTDGVAAEHGFVDIVPYQEGFLATWLDGRFTKKMSDHHDGHGGGGAMTLRAAQISLEGEVSKRYQLDDRVCDCCNTAAVATKQGVTVFYRNRSDEKEEIRDIYRTSYDGAVWSTPVAVHNDNWKINGCPVNGPAIASNGTTIGGVWFTAANDTPRVHCIFSEDDGQQFSAPLRLDHGDAIGRVDVAMIEDSMIALWMEPNADQVVLQSQRVYIDGHKDPVVTIAETSAQRASGFPQIAIVGDLAYIAYTVLEHDHSKIHLASYSLK